jgi:hypothetical protein
MVAVLGALVLLGALTGGAASSEADRPLVAVTAAAPLDADRLADVLRSYMDEYEISVRAAAGAPPVADLRREVEGLRSQAGALRAFASVRVAAEAPGTAEVMVVDLITDKALVARLERPARDEDFYRSVALKVKALLRSALYEASSLHDRPALERLVAVPAPAASPARSTSLTAGYCLVTFPGSGLHQQGASVGATWSPIRFLTTGIAVRLLAPTSAIAGDVTVTGTHVPVVVHAELDRRGDRLGGYVGVAAQLALWSASGASAEATVDHARRLSPAVGVHGGARVRLWERAALVAGLSALEVLDADRYLVRGKPVLDPSGVQVAVDVGLQVELW